jgi:hypothetical protein
MRCGLVVLALVVLAAPAQAGRSRFGWLYDNEVLPERGVELQTWVYERNGRTDVNLKETSIWWGVLVGVTDQLELAFPVELEWLRSDAKPEATFTVEKFGAEARYRFTKQDLENPDGVGTLVRLAAKRDVGVRDRLLLEGDLVLGYTAGPVHLNIDAGFAAKITRDDREFTLRPGLGLAFEVKKDLWFGAEVYGEVNLDQDLKQTRWFGVGPGMAWTHGRFWLSASYLVGVYQIDSAPRVIWGVLL